jgi:hypothetical protein
MSLEKNIWGVFALLFLDVKFVDIAGAAEVG